ncbi:hypothetical protein GGI20_002906 [Coemansia sp. BCRC 34301]|nr:hypothetical protein GGI20_002906 [Coemansia sp. BCRC 34301]
MCNKDEQVAIPTSGVWSRAWASWLGHVGGRPSEVVRWFMPFWFTVCMGTGILSTCLGRTPYTVSAIRWTGIALYILNILLLTAFAAVLIAQVIVFPEIVTFMRQHPQRMLHYGAIPMALATVVTGTTAFGFHEQSSAVLYVAWAVWWMSVVLAWASAMLLICLAVSHATQSIEAVTGAWLLLVAPLTVCAASGGALAEVLPSGAAFVTLVSGYALAGAGVPLTCTVVGLYVHRIAVHKLPPHDAILTAFIPLGPVAQIGVAALALGTAAQDLLPQVLEAPLGPTLYALGVIVALAAWGSAVFWALHAVFSVVYRSRYGAVPFNMGWWALTFPVGVFATLTAGLGDALEMQAFRVAALMIVALLLVLWLVNVVRTVAGLWTGDIFDIRGLMATYDSSDEATSGAGKTSMRSMIFSNYVASDTRRLGATIDVEHSTVQFMGDLNLNIWDCGGQHKYLDNYLNEQKENIFGNVEVLIYVFDLETTNKESEYALYDECLVNLGAYSRDAKVYALVHKMDKLPDPEQKELRLEAYRRELAKRSEMFRAQVYGTSIWDHSLFQAWSQIVHRLVPNMATIERHLASFRELAEASEVVLFERATFLVVSHQSSSDDEYVAGSGHLERHLGVSQSIKKYRNSCAGMQALFQSFELRNKSYALFIEPFTKSTYILVITTDPEIEPALTKANIKAARAHFNKFM